MSPFFSRTSIIWNPADGHEHERSDDEGHDGHAAYGVGTDYGDGVRSHGREQEGDDGHDDKADQRLPDVVHDASECEESENGKEGDYDAEDDGFHCVSTRTSVPDSLTTTYSTHHPPKISAKL